jgi:GH35 family endo-1,4-beta-xylanase
MNLKSSLLVFCAVFISIVDKGTAQNISSDQFYFGAVVHLGWDSGVANIADLRLKAIGFNSYRTEWYWEHLERERGKYSFTLENYANNVLDRYIMNRQFLLPSKQSPAPLIVLDYGNNIKYDGGFEYGATFPPTVKSADGFSNYAKAVASRYKDKVPLFEVWNEWNGGVGSGPKDENTNRYALSFNGKPCAATWPKKYCWTNAGIKDKDGRYSNNSATMPEEYLKLLKPTYNKIKRVAPNSKVLAGATAGLDWPWTQRFVEAGGLNYSDGFSVHQYFDGTIGAAKMSPENAIGVLDVYQEDFKRMLYKYTGEPALSLKDIPIYITEMGISTFKTSDYHGKQGHRRAASELVKYLLLARTRSYIKGIWVFSLWDRDFVSFGADNYVTSTDKESSYGLFYRDKNLLPKCIATVLKELRVAEILTDGIDFKCKVDGKEECRRVLDGGPLKDRYLLGLHYQVSWKDKQGMHHVATWEKDKIDINVDAKQIDSVACVNGMDNF